MLIIACSPSSFNAMETVSTLRFGTRAKSITNKVVLNKTRSVEELEALLARAEKNIENLNDQIGNLSTQLQLANMSGGGSLGTSSGSTEAVDLMNSLQNKIVDLEAQLLEERCFLMFFI